MNRRAVSAQPTIRWVLYPRWRRYYHAWRHGERESACGTLTAAHLKEHPASDIVTELTDGQRPCGTCKRIIESGSPASSWLGFISRHLKRVHCIAPRRDLEALAGLLVETGPPDDPTALELFEQVKELLLTPMRTRTRTGKQVMRLVGLREALERLPPRSGNLARVASTMRVWRHVMGRTDPVRCRPDKIIGVMLQVPEPEPYLQHLKTRGLEQLGVAFHENVLARAKKDPALRGLFSGSSEYWKHTADQLHVVTDD